MRTALFGTEEVQLNQMKVTVDRGIVYLMGIVTREEARRAANVAAGVSGVQMVVTVFNIESEEYIRERLKNLNNAQTKTDAS